MSNEIFDNNQANDKIINMDTGEKKRKSRVRVFVGFSNLSGGVNWLKEVDILTEEEKEAIRKKARELERKGS